MSIKNIVSHGILYAGSFFGIVKADTLRFYYNGIPQDAALLKLPEGLERLLGNDLYKVSSERLSEMDRMIPEFIEAAIEGARIARIKMGYEMSRKNRKN